jgi:acetyl-CoA C-acetyltransferase
MFGQSERSTLRASTRTVTGGSVSGLMPPEIYGVRTAAGPSAVVTLIDMARSVIVSAVRTPFGKLGGGLAGHQATELGAIAIREALRRAGLEPEEVEYVIMGQVLQAGAGQAPARQAAIGAGIPKEVGADTINKVCASSIRAVEIADSMIRAGDRQVIVTGGMESMSNAPYILKNARFGYRLGDGTLIDSMTHDGLTSTFDNRHMIEQASFVSRELGISREEQDRWALRSHERAVQAIDEGRFAEEIVPVDDVAVDEGPRRDTSLEKLAALKPVFDPEGTTTAGNAPGVNDGAGAVIVTSEEFAQKRGLEILGTIVSQGAVADDFAYLARTPAKAGSIALEKAGKSIDDVERVELNEAFSSVVLNSAKMLGADEEKVNVNGGAVALGHPIGASGARILGTMVHELRRNGGGLGLAAICSGGGQGDALLIDV